jgi:hypothetical protein
MKTARSDIAREHQHSTACGLQGTARTPPPYGIDLVDRLPDVIPGGGVGLPADLRRSMEASFGVDFSAVRVHEGPQAESIDARAYTRGPDIHFAPGQYQPATQRGRELIGHELVHVVQQSRGRVRATMQASGMHINDDNALEREADELGAKAVRGERVQVPAGSSAGMGGVQAAQRKQPNKLSWAKVDTTFNAWYAKTKDVESALAKTKQLIGGPFPDDYVPPPRRVSPKPTTPAGPGVSVDAGTSADPGVLATIDSSADAVCSSMPSGPLPAPDFGTLDPKGEDPAHPLGGWEGLAGVPFMIPSDVGKEILNPKIPADTRFPGARKFVKRAGAVWDLYDVPQSLYDATLAPLINNVHRPNQETRAQYSMLAIEGDLLELHQAMGILTEAGLATEADREWAINQQQQLEDEHTKLQDLLDSGALQGPFKAGWPVIDFIPGGSLVPQIVPGTKAFDDAERLIRLKDIGDCPRCDARPFKGTVVDQNRLR